MSALAKTNILEWLGEHGRATKIEIYDAFALVAKRVVDVALQELLDAKLIIAGDTHYAPARAARKVEAVPPPPPPVKQPKPPTEAKPARQKPAHGKTAETWKDRARAPAVRIVQFLRWAGGERPTDEVLAEFEDLPDAKRVLADMVQAGHVHFTGNSTVREGRAPKAPPPNAKTAWREGRSDLPPRTPDTPSERESERKPEASGTSEEPEAVATPTRAGDAPDESAASESPAPAIGPAQAPELPKAEGSTGDSDTEVHTAAPADSTQGHASAKADDSPAPGIGPAPADTGELSHEDIEQFHDIARELLNDTHALDQEPDTMADPARDPQTQKPEPAPTTAARVLVELPGLTIEVKGTPDAVRGAVRAIDFESACFDAA